MDDDFDPPFDFSVDHGRSSGARIEISPGNAEPDLGNTINIDERTLWLIEFFIYDILNDSDTFSHYGNSKLDIESWINAIHKSQKYLLSICDTTSIGKMWADRGYCELANELEGNHEIAIPGFKKLLQILSELATTWAKSYKSVFIFGV